MALASRILSILLGLAVIALLLWPINIPLGFGQAWWAKEMAAKRQGEKQTAVEPTPPVTAALPEAPAPAAPPVPPPEQAPPAPQAHAVPDPTAAQPKPTMLAAEKAEAERLAALQKANEAPPPSKLYYKVRVIDAGTIQSGSVTVTLADIAVRDAKAMCKDAKGRSWACGEAGRVALAKLIRARAVTCALPTGGEQKSFAARCSVAGTDLSTWVVRQGWANPKDTSVKTLAEAEDAAKKEKIGLWRSVQ